MARIKCDELGLTITFRYGYIHGRRAVACYLERDDGQWWGGLAQCSREDRFVKEKGRVLALARAAKAYTDTILSPSPFKVLYADEKHDYIFIAYYQRSRKVTK
jgi:hypothetical protein